MKRQPNTIYTLSLSYGKDSLACLGVIKELGLPLDRIIHAEIWATETIPADLPPMVEFKKKADKIIKERYGIEVEHVCATKKMGGGGCYLTSNNLAPEQSQKSTESISTDSQNEAELGAFQNSNKTCLQKLTYEDIFYREMKHRGGGGTRLYGFPIKGGQWCNNLLKVNAINNIRIPIRKFYGGMVQRTQNKSNQGYTDSRGTSIWEEVNGVRVSNETQSGKSFLQAQARWAV